MNQPPYRGISMGTVFMLLLTAAVLVCCALIFPKLMGTADLDMDVGGMLAALTLEADVPELAMHDIPIVHVTPAPTSSDTPEATATPSPEPTPEPTATPFPGGKVTITIGGSVNIDDAIRKSAYYSDSGKYSFDEMLSLLTEELQSDLTILPLENITNSAAKVSELNAPAAVMDMLKSVGVDVVTLGFAKAADNGLEALHTTISEANARKLVSLGAYADPEDASRLRMFTYDHVNVALLHYTHNLSSAGKKNLDAADAAWALPEVEAAVIAADVLRAREEGAHVVIVSLHWGKASSSKPNSEQKALAQIIADAGADIIVGSGTRVVQPVSWLTSKDESGNIRHTLCAWNLGSILNESRKDGNVAGALLQLQLSFDGTQISFARVNYVPTYIWRYQMDEAWQYRVAVANQTPPDGMSDEQAGYMEKAFRNIQKVFDGSPATLR